MPKPSSGRKRKGVEIPFANSIKEANQLAVQYGLAEKANFAGLDILAANEMIQYLNLTRNDFPDAFDKLEFMGSIKAFRKEFRNKYKIHASNSAFACCAFPPENCLAPKCMIWDFTTYSSVKRSYFTLLAVIR